MKKLLLVDGNSVLFRAYYSTIYTNPMSTSTGIPTNAVFGFISMLNKAISTMQPDAILVAWDAGKKTFRHDKFDDYKGTRKPLDEELIVQMPIVREFLDENGIVRYEQEGYEADDIIGSMAKAAEDMDVSILTGDKDLLQLVNDHTKVLMMKKGVNQMAVMDEAAIDEQYGLKPIQIIDLKGLMGDPSDNIPGVKHIGEKTALLLLHKYGSIEETYAHLDEIKGKRHEYLEEGRDSALLSKELATIFTQMKLPFDIADLMYNPNEKNPNTFYQKYEMRSLLTSLPTQPEESKSASIIHTSECPFTAEDEIILMPVADQKPFMEQSLFGFMLCENSPKKEADKVYYLNKEDALKDDSFKKLLENGRKITTWNVKESLHLFDRNGFALPNFQKDLHLAAFLLYSQATSLEALLEACEITLPVSLKDLNKKSLGGFTEERAIPVFGKWISELPALDQKLFALIEDENLHELYWDVEFPLARVLYEMECQGISISKSILLEIGKNYQARMDEIAQRIYGYAGHTFNIGSPKQLGEVLFDELKLKSSTKKRSTAAEVLEKLRDAHPIIEDILEYRMYSKIVTTYVDGLKKYIIDDKIYTTFNQTMTQTGRLSSSDPNLQNISIKSEEGREIRKAFVAPENDYFISADYSQVELRMLAHMANEEFMIEAFQEGTDIHNRTASIIFGVEPDQVTDAQRRTAKTVNFAIIYGQTEFGLSQELKISRVQARNFIRAYFQSYPNIHRFMDGLISGCEENGYVETLMHRRRYIPEIKDKNFMTREFGKRAAMNAPIQGSAADLIKIAMLRMDQAIKEKNLKSKMLLQIHDELIFRVPEDELELMQKLIPEVMDSAMKLNVPLQASVNTGKTWYEAK
ncbi:DNA polymerase I [Ileibacterium valens]|uniref:DNA polymerase I n=1 Tax=Ileibacterium valens TaxID=1862668 RepID=UPI00272C7F5B|nr:DNA polymerase I [Ileibacterium valens]